MLMTLRMRLPPWPVHSPVRTRSENDAMRSSTAEAHRFGVLDLDPNGRVIDFQEKPKEPRGAWASMGVYVFNKDVLVEQLQADADMGEASAHDFGPAVGATAPQAGRLNPLRYTYRLKSQGRSAAGSRCARLLR